MPETIYNRPLRNRTIQGLPIASCPLRLPVQSQSVEGHSSSKIFSFNSSSRIGTGEERELAIHQSHFGHLNRKVYEYSRGESLLDFSVPTLAYAPHQFGGFLCIRPPVKPYTSARKVKYSILAKLAYVVVGFFVPFLQRYLLHFSTQPHDKNRLLPIETANILSQCCNVLLAGVNEFENH